MELGMKGGMRECPLAAAALIFVALTIAAPPPTAVRAEEELQPTVKIAVAVSLTGASNVFGVPALDGARLAVDEANVEGLGPHLDLEAFDDASDPDKGRDIAEKVAASDAHGSLHLISNRSMAPSTRLMA